jgi:hypothetical protein
MIDAFRWWRSLRHNANFWAWMRDSYDSADLQRLATEATDADLLNPFEPGGDLTLDQAVSEYDERRTTVKRLYRRYGKDIWHACMADYDGEKDSTIFSCFARLELAEQVDSPSAFEEFLVRNALKRAARQICQGNRFLNVDGMSGLMKERRQA